VNQSRAASLTYLALCAPDARDKSSAAVTRGRALSTEDAMITRRQFLQASSSLALAPLLPHGIMAATTLRTRPAWSSFRAGPLYPFYLEGVRKMRANTNTTKPASWTYWTNVHASQCPHGKPYFLAWHRGFLARFEAQLRKASGRSDMVLPYWDYYSDPILPAEFRDTSSPLYHKNRKGRDVSAALSMGAFDPGVTNFQRGKASAFEPALESAPHNGVHNLIGGTMDNLAVSPRDPIFWLHHANIDRLWDAWVLAGGGRHMPAKTAAYWSGTFSYGAAVAGMKRVEVYATADLGYRYDNSTLPGGYAVAKQSAALALPPVQDAFAETLPEQGSSLGGVARLSLGPRPIRVRIPLSADARNRVRSLSVQADTSLAAGADTVRIVLDGVSLTRTGEGGGYFYKILLNLPARGVAQPESTYLIGTLGPFEISVAQHARSMAGGGHAAMHGPVRLTLPAHDALRRIWPSTLDELTLTFLRVDAGTATSGDAIGIDRVWVETSP